MLKQTLRVSWGKSNDSLLPFCLLYFPLSQYHCHLSVSQHVSYPSFRLLLCKVVITSALLLKQRAVICHWVAIRCRAQGHLVSVTHTYSPWLLWSAGASLTCMGCIWRNILFEDAFSLLISKLWFIISTNLLQTRDSILWKWKRMYEYE